MSSRYSIGLDFGSLSVRGLLVNVDTGEELASAIFEYPHGIITELPDGTALPTHFALQYPDDYLQGAVAVIREVMFKTGISPQKVIGIGIDSTASTILPVDTNGIPLCMKKEFMNEAHGYIKLWKHRGANQYAEHMRKLAIEMREPWLSRFGNIITPEWFFPKIAELAEQAPNVYAAATSIIELGDWIVWQFTGTQSRSIALARCNGLFTENTFPDEDYFAAVSPSIKKVVGEKLQGIYLPLGACAGGLTIEAAKNMGLCPGTAVGPAIVDSHASVAASGAMAEGDMIITLGTSAVEILLLRQFKGIPGIHISAQDGSIPGLYSAGGGQCSVGDSYEWFIKNCVPETYTEEARRLGLTIHQLLRNKANGFRPGKSGLMALDWWNGVRTPLFRFDFSGLLLGLTIRTRPEEIYRALLEATAFGIRRTVELFKDNGYVPKQLFAVGGIPQKDPFLMQMIADVLNLPIHICRSKQTCALGSAILGAVAADPSHDFNTAVERMSSSVQISYIPNKDNYLQYNRLYHEYLKLSEYISGSDSPLRAMIQIQQEEN
jgi:L-ribulokinase